MQSGYQAKLNFSLALGVVWFGPDGTKPPFYRYELLRAASLLFYGLSLFFSPRIEFAQGGRKFASCMGLKEKIKENIPAAVEMK